MTGSGDESARVTIRTAVGAPAQATAEDRALLPRRMTSAAEIEARDAALRTLVAPALAALEANPAWGLPEGGRQRAEAALAAFEAVYEGRPVRDNRGGSGFNDSLWLFVLARAFAPALIVESGTHKGHSAWLFRQACPEAEIHSFDVSWDRLEHRQADVTYHNSDWSEADQFSPNPSESLVFLDDHIGHARRIREAWAGGFRLLLLDDNFPAHQLHATGGPPVPTLAMLLEPAGAGDREITWTRNGKDYAYRFRQAEAAPARALIRAHLALPELAPASAYPPGSGLTLAKLVD